jgi:hypothetical protein
VEVPSSSVVLSMESQLAGVLAYSEVVSGKADVLRLQGRES